jgi:SAM-dependent methyltransferase
MIAPPDLLRWNERYSAEGYLFGTAPNAFLAGQKHRLRAGQTALAIADGEGRNGVWLAEQGLDVLALDFSPVALEKSRRLAAARGVTLRTQQADLRDYAWEADRFDLVVAIFIQFAPPPFRAVLFEGIRRTLKPGGLLLMQGYRPEQLAYGTGGPPNAENMYTAALLREAFAGFAILHLDEHDSPIAEGSGHNGMSALIDLSPGSRADRHGYNCDGLDLRRHARGLARTVRALPHRPARREERRSSPARLREQHVQVLCL